MEITSSKNDENERRVETEFRKTRIEMKLTKYLLTLRDT